MWPFSKENGGSLPQPFLSQFGIFRFQNWYHITSWKTASESQRTLLNRPTRRIQHQPTFSLERAATRIEGKRRNQPIQTSQSFVPHSREVPPRRPANFHQESQPTSNVRANDRDYTRPISGRYPRIQKAKNDSPREHLQGGRKRTNCPNLNDSNQSYNAPKITAFCSYCRSCSLRDIHYLPSFTDNSSAKSCAVN
jgi:hypothetical protein